MKTLALLLLLPGLALGQGLTTSPPGGSTKRTNFALHSNDMSSATAAVSPWTLQTATVATVAGAPDGVGGGTWAEVTSTANTGNIKQIVTVTSTSSIAASAWAQKPSGTGGLTSFVQCGAGTVTSCACSFSDGTACTATAGSPTADICRGQGTIGTSVVRLRIVARCSTAITALVFYLIPSDYGLNLSTTRFAGAQIEAASKVNNLCVTTTAARTCK